MVRRLSLAGLTRWLYQQNLHLPFPLLSYKDWTPSLLFPPSFLSAPIEPPKESDLGKHYKILGRHTSF